MRRLAAVLLSCSLASGCAGTAAGFRRDESEARKDFRLKTRHEKAAALASVVPGGGWVYEENAGKSYGWDVSPGAFYFAATVGAVLFARANAGDPALLALGVGSVAVLRFNDVRWSLHFVKENERQK